MLVAKEEQKNKIISISLRSQKVDLHELLNKALIGLNGSGGGHEHACGAHIAKKDFEKFINNLQDSLK